MNVEAERPMSFHCELKDQLMVRHFVGQEMLGQCFEYVVTLYSENATISLDELLGTHATVEVRMGLPKPRYFDGIVCECTQLGRSETYFVYRVVLRPWLWLLSQQYGCEVFQNASALEIARDLFGKGTGDKPATQRRAQQRASYALFDDERLLLQFPQREYCVQYRESDLNFMSRVLERAGIYYYFTHELGRHKLVLADSIISHDSREGFEVIGFCRQDDLTRPELGHFYAWSTTKQTTSGGVVLKDFDFTKSRANLEVIRGATKHNVHGDAEIYDYPGGYSEWGPGEQCVNLCLQAAQTHHELARGMTNSLGISVGSLFCLDGYEERPDQNRQYLTVAARYELDSGSFRSDGGGGGPLVSVSVTAIPSEVPFRPARKTPAPFVPGPQSARVVGPKGATFCTDPWARVKVQFAWDRDGKFDENSSCFVRVSQGWAGSNFGAIHIPRIGQEVIVEFLDGDIDRPIVTGRVYNDFNQPFYDPQTLACRSGFKTQTVGGPPDHYNELRFDDSQGAEEIVVRAQRDFMAHVLHDKSTTIDNNHSHTVKQDLRLTVSEGSYATAVQSGRMTVDVPNADLHARAKEIKLEVNPAVSIAIGQEAITLSFGSNSITLSASGIDIQGLPVRINC